MGRAPTDGRYTVAQVLAIAGISRRQLDHWRTLGIIWPDKPGVGSGNGARFTDADLAWIVAIAVGVRSGVNLGTLAAAARDGTMSEVPNRLREAADLLENSRPWWLDRLLTSM